MIGNSIVSCVGQTPLVSLHRLFPEQNLDVIAKLEFLNPGGSVKDRPASYIVEKGLQDGTIPHNSHLIESSSGNFGVALAMIAKLYQLEFTCVVDPKISPTNRRILELLGANIDMVHEPDEQGGYLNSRIQRVQELLQSIPQSKWLNQYANELNWKAHYYNTSNEILADLHGSLDYLILSVSTTGTIMGISRRLREEFPYLRIIAVDATGSVIFGGPSGPRKIPGIGASRVPELLNSVEIDEVVYVSDQEAVRGCRDLITWTLGKK